MGGERDAGQRQTGSRRDEQRGDGKAPVSHQSQGLGSDHGARRSPEQPDDHEGERGDADPHHHVKLASSLITTTAVPAGIPAHAIHGRPVAAAPR